MFKRKLLPLGFSVITLALLMTALLPVSSFAQRRWRSHRSRIVVYQPSPYVIYQRRPQYRYRYNTYAYRQPYYTYNSNQRYVYTYRRPYYTNRYRYSYARPNYYNDYYGYRARYRNRGLRLGIRWR
jgi:hypothetical protein